MANYYDFGIKARYCDSCKFNHGGHFICETYSEQLKQSIKVEIAKHRENLTNPEWVKGQIENGTPHEVIRIARALESI